MGVCGFGVLRFRYYLGFLGLGFSVDGVWGTVVWGLRGFFGGGVII